MSVTRWIEEIKAGNYSSLRQLLEIFFPRMEGLANSQLRGSCRMADGEDVAASAFATFVRRVGEGLFQDVHDRDSLWSLLATIVRRKASDLLRHESCLKRGGNTLGATNADRDGVDVEEVLDPGLSPDLRAQAEEEFRRLLHVLNNDSLRKCALLKFADFTNREIADRLLVDERTVERKLNLIRRNWRQQ
jgi:RNA polymerase sigma factor (sigma-70 family)